MAPLLAGEGLPEFGQPVDGGGNVAAERLDAAGDLGLSGNAQLLAREERVARAVEFLFGRGEGFGKGRGMLLDGCNLSAELGLSNMLQDFAEQGGGA